jgi:septum site-determining protein MinD
MKESSKRTVINVISGKGGTGKTLLACVLADMLGTAMDTSVIVVDLDVFVRGLTSLLYFHREERLRIAKEDELVVADYFVQKLVHPDRAKNRIAVAKYRSFHVVPAVSRIDELLSFRDLSPDNRDEARAILGNLLANIPDEFGLVLLDSRAGYDELISATHEISTVSICVEEEDPISRVTADNLVAQLRTDSKTPVFRLINKARGITSEKQLGRSSGGVTDIGVIPFDMDVMNSFGSREFWDVISRSLYRSAVAQSWNLLVSKMQIGVKLTVPRASPVGNERFEAYFGLFSTKDRVFLFYGLMVAALGIAYGVLGREFIYDAIHDPLRLMAFLAGIAGLFFSVSVLVRSRKPR